MKVLIDNIAQEIYEHQGCAWNGGCWNGGKPIQLKLLTQLFYIINSPEFEKLPYCYSGNLFRIHPPHCCLKEDINKEIDILIRTNTNGEGIYVEKTQYTSNLTAFSKNCDFTHMKKVSPSEKAMLFHINTFDRIHNKEFYGIDINEFFRYYDLPIDDRFIREQEVLFVLQKQFIIDERLCTPAQFKYYKRAVTHSN